eukprot:CAMPEP_0116095596 /NCGR_PEP_ID=MMETSP0327-20121206/9748_1 /TAXON_ID=44447 /ORGANISM="Pseudo-nitzschia delicatissima, Strain B596" /LENGTH=454 /DNA_ID=CAMNT_0003587275 /DNA_START=106 /DNA_END=1470 /DNA_ORIENTATION=-
MGFNKDKDNKTGCGRKLFYVLAALSVVTIGGTTAWYFLYFAKDVESLVGDCGGCHCIPDEDSECPSEIPPASYPEETINAWKSQTILNPYVLTCNPYSDGVLCDAEPPIDPDFEWAKLGETAVCAIHYEQENASRRRLEQTEVDIDNIDEQTEIDIDDIDEQTEIDIDNIDEQTEIEIDNIDEQTEIDIDNIDADNALSNATTAQEDEVEIVPKEAETCETKDTKFYRIKTYPSAQDAELAGGFVTHTGNCGVCSTLQDLAVYANIDFIGATSPGNFCRRQAATSFENGLACYRGLGMTQDCAKIWADTSWNTAKSCFGSCVLKSTLPQFRGEGTEIKSEMAATNTTDDSGHAWYDLPATLRDAFVKSETEVNSQESKVEDDNKVQAMPSNGPAPECALNDCITCNDEVSAPVFEKFAGRSRHRSGLLSTAARRCSSLPNIIQHPCPDTLPLSE